jgi:hypothetical protein
MSATALADTTALVTGASRGFGGPGRRPGGSGGYGLWLVRQLCDRMQIRTGPGGTLIEIRMSLRPAPAA